MMDKRLLALLGKDKKYVVFIVICNLLTTVCGAVLALALCAAVDRLYKGGGFGGCVPALLWGAGAVLVRFLLSLLNGAFTARLGSRAKVMLRRRIYEKVVRLGVRETDELSLASLTQVGVEGVEQLDQYYSAYVPRLFYSVLSPVILFVLLMQVSVPSAVVLLCCVPLIPMSIIAVNRYAKKIFARYWGQYTRMGDAFLDNISGMKELKIFGTDGLYHERMNGEAEEFRKITMKVLTMQLASTTIMDLVAYAGAGAGIAVAAARNMSIHPFLQMSTPALVLLVVLTAVDFFLPLRALGSAFHVAMNGATAGKKILRLLDTPEPVWGTEKVTGYDAVMEHVTFAYGEGRSVLKDISLEARPGSLTAVVGVSGSGKSTIISLFTGLRRAQSGRVAIGGKAVESLSREDYCRHMGSVGSGAWLFNDTVRNNFRMAKPDITDEEIAERLRSVDLKEVTDENGGADMMLSEGAVNLSGGQRQRLALAVALAADRDIYFFDEVTSNIDAESEEIIMKNIYELSRTRTVLMVSHRLKNFLNAGKIYCLKDGAVDGCGTHEELMAQRGTYYELFTRQTELEEGYRRCAE